MAVSVMWHVIPNRETQLCHTIINKNCESAPIMIESIIALNSMSRVVPWKKLGVFPQVCKGEMRCADKRYPVLPFRALEARCNAINRGLKLNQT